MNTENLICAASGWLLGTATIGFVMLIRAIIRRRRNRQQRRALGPILSRI